MFSQKCHVIEISSVDFQVYSMKKLSRMRPSTEQKLQIPNGKENINSIPAPQQFSLILNKLI
jgi:hypothetical protein